MNNFHKMDRMAIIVAVDELGGFGKGGKIPWEHPEDFKHFQATTKGHVCIMGRKTYEDMLAMKKAKSEDPIIRIMEDRESFVVTSNPDYKPEGATAVKNIRAAVQSLSADDTRTIFILGGDKIFTEALTWTDLIQMTIVEGTYECDRFFPLTYLTNNFNITQGTEQGPLKFVNYVRKR